MALKITNQLTKHNRTVSNRTKSNIKYIVIHYVGALGGAKANCNYYASKYIGASAHYYVDFNGSLFRSVKDKDIAWHCGASTYKHATCRNSNSIGIEMCVRKKSKKTMNATDKDWYFEEATVKATIELVKELMKKYNIPIANIIRHHDVTGKVCPNPFVYNNTKHTWNAFKKELTEKQQSNTPAKKEAAAPKDTSPKAKESKKEYQVKTTCNVLNIRSGAGKTYKVVGKIKEKAGKKNRYTIVAEKNGWGKLKSGAGWIRLSYTKKIS